MITQAPRGTADWFGDEMAKRERIEQICKETADLFNIKQIATPVFEHTVLFTRGVGETTDVVQKEMYTFEDKGGRSISLKPEGTAGVIRAYVEHSMYAEGGLKKLFYITPAFRYEKPQSGRLRQHHQFGVEYIGSPSPFVEAELICLVSEVIKKLGLNDIEVHINSIGCRECRKKYNEALLKYLDSRSECLCKVCKERMVKNPLRVLDCKVPECKEVVAGAPRTVDFLDDECRAHFEELQSILDSLGINYKVDTGIVRGLDYYTRTVFEFVNKDGFTLCGGGRYDGLVHEVENKLDIPAAGFGMGLERILYFLGLEGIDFGGVTPPDVYIGMIGDVKTEVFKIVSDLREQGARCETDYLGKSVKAQMKYANKINAPYVVMIGEDEIRSGTVRVKDMSDGTETGCSIDSIFNIIKAEQVD